ncbi:hypothetical protein [Mumia sp. Pv 4-285]|uniref:hypothetical protein n=1 Tax=Mumia qirimensis TaxID=3234852 RepID=UPI00351D4D87
MNTLFKRASAALAGGALAFSGLALVSAAPAAADTLDGAPIGKAGARVTAATLTPQRPVDILSASASSYVVNSASEYGNIAVRGSAATDIISTYTITANLYRGATRLGSVRIYTNGNGYLTFPNRWGRGTFRVANFRITGTLNSAYNYQKFDYVDGATGGYFTAKSALPYSAGKVRYRYGSSKKVATIKLKRYTTSGWKNYKTKVQLQRKKGGWKKVKTLKLNRKGKASYTFYSSKKYKYRFVVKGTSTTAGGKFTLSSKV